MWDLDPEVLLGGVPLEKSVHYTTAKVVLVGDSGVGKTGLGWRLAHREFKEHASTHGQQFWVIDELGQRRVDGTQCEVVLWDLAGQPDYRLVHCLFLEDVNLALLLFDPTSREKPLAGVEYWLKQLRGGQGEERPTVLVGARVDRGTATLTLQELEDYCGRHGIEGRYIATSAKSGEGLPELLERIKALVPWDKMPATITTATFKRTKDYVLALKQDADRSRVMVTQEELGRRLRESDPGWAFDDDEMMTAVGHLENHGYVTVLRGFHGERAILLLPVLLVNLAASIVLEARRSPEGLGVLEEDRLLRGGYTFPELAGLADAERAMLLDAATVLFLRRNVCFRETFNERTLLVFPSLINEKRPRTEDIETIDDMAYQVGGAVENVYAALVVLLGYTNTFTRTHHWQNQAQYEMGPGEVCGFRLAAEHEGEIELVLYFGRGAPEYTLTLFRGLFERFLSRRRDVTITRLPPVVCPAPSCGKRQERTVVRQQIESRRPFLFCFNCGQKVTLPELKTLAPLSRGDEETLNQEQGVARRRTAFAAALVRVKGLLRERGGAASPSCFVSYAWGDAGHEKWVRTLATDLRDAGINVVFDRWHCKPGTNLSIFVDRIESSDCVVVVGTPGLREKYTSTKKDPVVASELKIVNNRLMKPSLYGDRIIPILRSGSQDASFPPLLAGSVSIDFQDEPSYFVRLFELIWNLYNLPLDDPGLDELKSSMA